MRAKGLAFSPCSLGFFTAWWLGTRESQVEAVSPFMAKAQKSYSITPISIPVTRVTKASPYSRGRELDSTLDGRSVKEFVNMF